MKLKVRDRILKVASERFYHQGFNQTGINQIIAEADIAIGSLYKHFPSKHELLVAYLKRQELEWFSQFDMYIQGVTDPGEKVFRFIKYRIEHQAKSDFAGCPFLKIVAELGSSETDILQLVEDHKNRQRLLLSGFIKQARYDGPLDKKLLSEILFLMTEGAIAMSTTAKTTTALVNVLKFAKKTLS